MNRFMRTITLIVGIVLIVLGLYQVLAPSDVLINGESVPNTGDLIFSTESIVFIVMGVVAVAAGLYKK